MIDRIIHGDALEILKQMDSASVNMCVTSPPYFGLRDYGHEDQIGLEDTPEEYVEKLVGIFREVRRVLKDDGTLWLNLGDSYSGSGKGGNSAVKNHNHCEEINSGKLWGLKPKDLIGIPWMVAFALRGDGWYLRQDIIWHKPNPMPESVQDRCTKSHEYIFLLSKSKKYYFDHEAIKTEVKQDWGTRDRTNGKYHNEGTGLNPHGGLEKSYEMANKKSVWTVNTKPFKEAHFAVFPEKLIVDCIKAGCPEGGIVLDPFIGAGTTAVVAKKLNRNFRGIELKQEYIDIANNRLYSELGMFK